MLLNQPTHAQANRANASETARRGFTLMEMMVVVAIIIILIGISVPFVINYWNNSKIDATKAKIQNMQNAAQTYMMNNNVWPSAEQLIQADPSGRQPVLRQQDIIDSWGNPIVIDPQGGDGTRPHIYSQGPPGSGRQISNTQNN